MPDPLEALRERLRDVLAANQQISDVADSEGRAMSQQEYTELNAGLDEADQLQSEIATRERLRASLASAAASSGRVVDPQQPISGERDRSGGRQAPAGGGSSGGRGRTFPAPRDPATQARGGFETMGHYLLAVRQAGQLGGRIDPRLQGTPVRQDITDNFANETAGADGGFMVPPDFRNVLISRIQNAEDSLLARCDQLQTSSNMVSMPVDVDEVWNNNSGVLAFWENEGGIKTESKLNLDQMNIRLNKIIALVPVTDELLEDAPAIEGYIRKKAPDKINFKISRAIYAGSGNGQPQGIMVSGAKITVAPGATPSGQIQFANIAAMWGRLYGPFRNRAVWIVNPELDAQLMTMFFSVAPVATTPATPIPVYLPGNTVANQPYSTLLGRPVIPSQVCEPMGTEGDIMFADLTQYLALMKTNGIRTDVSIHVYFVQDITAFRFVMRIGGMSWLPSPYQPRAGTFTQSPFVTLGSR